MPSGASKPREPRTAAGIKTQGARTPEIIEKYKVPADVRERQKITLEADDDGMTTSNGSGEEEAQPAADNENSDDEEDRWAVDSVHSSDDGR